MEAKTSTTIHRLARAYRACMKLAPARYRRLWEDDATRTFRAVCESARTENGAMAMWTEAFREWLNLVRTMAQMRLGTAAKTPRDVGTNDRTTTGGRFSMRWLTRDLRSAVRALIGGRGTAAIAISTLALGIGLSTAVFSILDSVLWRPVPYPNANRLVEMATFNTQRKFMFMGVFSPALITAWRSQTDLFDRIEGYDTPSIVYTTAAGSDMVAGAVVTPGLFSLLGATPEAGRIFVSGEGQTTTTNLALVSDAFWRTRLLRDPHAVGREIMLDGETCRIVGVLPASFRFPNGTTDIWMPYDVAHPPVGEKAARNMTPIARLAPGLAKERAAPIVFDRGARINATTAAATADKTTAEIYGIDGSLTEETLQSLWVLAGAVGFLFLVVCANVANLALSRSIQRARDFAVRAALGASRLALIRETLVENMLVAITGCALGVGFAVVLLRAAVAVLPETLTTTSLTAMALDARAMAFAVALGSLASVIFGLPAAIVASGTSITDLLGASSRSSTGSATSRRLRSGLVIVEVAVSTALLVGAALMTRSLIKLETADKGFNSANLISIRLGLPYLGYDDPNTRDRFIHDAVDQLRKTPGITAATLGGLPTDYKPIMLGPTEFSSRPGEKTPELIMPMLEVPADYFSQLGLTVVAGRTFRPEDPADTVVVSESVARKYWPGGNAVGGQFRSQKQNWQTIIGVVSDIRRMSDTAAWQGLGLYYQTGKAPRAMTPVMPMSSIAAYRTIVVRAAQPAEAARLIPQVIHTVDPRVVVWQIALVDHLYADAIARPRSVFLLMTVFASVGLVLAMAGIYGVLSYLVAQRLREIGIRLALGARPSDIGRLILRSGVGLAIVGLAVGVILALALMHVVQSLLYRVEPSDPLSFIVVSIVLLLTATLASWTPARRAMRVDPLALLREE